MMEDYLVEKTLGNFLRQRISSDIGIIHNKSVPEISGFRKRPDFRVPDLNLVVEFDGDTHYSKASVILGDKEKDKILRENGYQIIRVPYFIQLSGCIVKLLFSKYISDFSSFNAYGHGFISKKAVLPADYCEIGIEKFREDLNRFACVKDEIIKSLKKSIQEHADWHLVVPPSLKQFLGL